MGCLTEILKNTWLGNFISAIIGGLIAGVASLLATRQAHKNNTKLQEKNRKAIAKSLSQAIYDEISMIVITYDEKIGPALDKLIPGKDAMMQYTIFSQDYLIIFNNNSINIGLIEDSELRKTIIRTYIIGKGLIDSLNMNREMVLKYHYYEELGRGTKNAEYGNMAHTMKANLIDYGIKLKDSHGDFKRETEKLISLFNQKGIM